MKFSITTNILDEVELHVFAIDICGIVLGSPYIYDRRDIFHHHEKTYYLFKNGIEYIVTSHNKNMNASLANVGQMKRILNASKNFALLILKHEDVVECRSLQGHD